MDKKEELLTVPKAIVLAGILIGGALFITQNDGSTVNRNPAAAQKEALPQADITTIGMRKVSPDEHILGNPNADIVIVEYSDLECPFCKVFHKTMNAIMDDYGKTGKVAWVYRHFPIDKPDASGRALHSKAGVEAEATECAAELGGNAKFWEYTNRLFEITPANNGLDLGKLPEIAEYVGLDVNAFKKCLESGKFDAKVELDYEDGLAVGVNGTPHSILIYRKTGDQYRINGAQPYPALKSMIDALLTAK